MLDVLASSSCWFLQDFADCLAISLGYLVDNVATSSTGRWMLRKRTHFGMSKLSSYPYYHLSH